MDQVVMKGGRKQIVYHKLFIFLYLFGFAFFYYKYVPLAESFQLVLAPLLVAILIVTFLKFEWGLLSFVFLFPLINNLPYFFKYYEHIVHAPISLVVCLVFILGYLLNVTWKNPRAGYPLSLENPLGLLFLLICVSTVITGWRYTNCFPFLSDHLNEIVVNADRVRAGGAIMSSVMTCLNYISGFALFLILMRMDKPKEMIRKISWMLVFSAVIYLGFALFQAMVNPQIGNTPYWASAKQINATFKDPNAFGAFEGAVIPIFLGMSLWVKGGKKILLWAISLLSFFVVAFSGSRSAFIAMAVSLVLFFVMFVVEENRQPTRNHPLKKYGFVVMIIAFLGFAAFSHNSVLGKRLSWSMDVLSKADPIGQLFTGKIGLWKNASLMMKDYPLSGVGIGAFIVEVPNYYLKTDPAKKNVDSAENFFLQIGAELGIPGLILTLWLCWELGRRIFNRWGEREGNREDRIITIAAVAGIGSLFVNFVFHSYIGSFEVKYIFWILVAVLFMKRENENGSENIKIAKKYYKIALVLMAFLGMIQLWNSTHGLSLTAWAERTNADQDFGFYQKEEDNRGFSFQWAQKRAGFAFEKIGDHLVIPVNASHPDIERNPVRVRIYGTNNYFNKNQLIKEIELTKNEWQNLEIDLSNDKENRVALVIETDREWEPYKYLKVPDKRKLAIGVGTTYFRYLHDLASEKVRKSPSIRWEKNVLISNSTSCMNIEIDRYQEAFRMWFKGDKALGIGPYIIIRIDDRVIGKMMLEEDGWNSYVFPNKVPPGEHVISVEYCNDYYDAEKRLDRNVLLGDVDILYSE
jgi:O-antigen ligase